MSSFFVDSQDYFTACSSKTGETSEWYSLAQFRRALRFLASLRASVCLGVLAFVRAVAYGCASHDSSKTIIHCRRGTERGRDREREASALASLLLKVC